MFNYSAFSAHYYENVLPFSAIILMFICMYSLYFMYSQLNLQWVVKEATAMTNKSQCIHHHSLKKLICIHKTSIRRCPPSS